MGNATTPYWTDPRAPWIERLRAWMEDHRRGTFEVHDTGRRFHVVLTCPSPKGSVEVLDHTVADAIHMAMCWWWDAESQGRSPQRQWSVDDPATPDDDTDAMLGRRIAELAEAAEAADPSSPPPPTQHPPAWYSLVHEVRRLHDEDARHKRGFLLSERSWIDALLHTIEELTEVGRAPDPEAARQELGDVLGCLIHLAIKLDLDLDGAAASALAKLPLDFPGSRRDVPEASDG